MKIPTKYVLVFVIILVTTFLWNMLSQPSVNDLPGDFREIASGQNENNTGPVRRSYIVTVKDTLWNEMRTYGDHMPYAKLGTTTVWFFLEGQPYPTQLSEGNPPFAPIYANACIARYEKNNMGTVALNKYPLR